MKNKFLTKIYILSLVLATGLTAGAASALTIEATEIATDAYVYGYSLITTEITRGQIPATARSDCRVFTWAHIPPGHQSSANQI